MNLLAFVYCLTTLVSIISFPENEITNIQKPAQSKQVWIGTRAEEGDFTHTAPSTIGLDSTMKNRPSSADSLAGKALIAGSDCRACHLLSTKAVGPSFTDIAQRYRDDKIGTSKLADKIINGGRGVWGESMMSAHPNLSKEEATKMVNYILSLKK